MIDNFYNCDCMEKMREMQDKSVEFTLTDIPYEFEERGSSESIRNLDYGVANDLTFDLTEFLDNVTRITKGSIVIFCGWDQFSPIVKYFIDLGKGTIRPLIWEKTNPLPLNGKLNYLSSVELAVWFKFNGVNATFNAPFKSPVFRYSVQAPDKIKSHPTKKNVDLFKEIILDNTNPGDTVFDPCCGSGTTIEASLLSNRKFIACEMNETYYKSTVKYLEQNYSMLLAMV